MQYIYIIILCITSYLLGSIPSGLILGKIFRNIDIREHGSGNTGASNALRVLGAKLGFFTFVFDFLKGMAVMLFLWAFKLERFYRLGAFNTEILFDALAVVGHAFPIYLNFKGGKAAATTAGVTLFIEPIVFLACILTFTLTFLKNRIVSIASLITAGVCLLLMISRQLLYSLFPIFILGFTDKSLQTYALEALVIVILVLIILIRHISNLKNWERVLNYPLEKEKKQVDSCFFYLIDSLNLISD